MSTASTFQSKHQPPKIDDIVTIKTRSFAYGIRVTDVYGERFCGEVASAPHKEVIGRAVDIGQGFIWRDQVVEAP